MPFDQTTLPVLACVQVESGCYGTSDWQVTVIGTQGWKMRSQCPVGKSQHTLMTPTYWWSEEGQEP